MSGVYLRRDLFKLISNHDWCYKSSTSHFVRHYGGHTERLILDGMRHTRCPFSLNDLRRYVCDLDRLNPRKVESILLWFWKGTDNEQ